MQHSKEVQMYVHNHVQHQVHMLDHLRVQKIRTIEAAARVAAGVTVLRQEHRQEATVLRQDRVQAIDHRDQVLQEEVIQAEVPAGVLVGVPAGVVEKNKRE